MFQRALKGVLSFLSEQKAARSEHYGKKILLVAIPPRETGGTLPISPDARGKGYSCCDMRLVQIRNQAAPSELAPKCLYRRPS
ncbi:hypothetical protein VN97_g10573 [Penicillium thymicola]|uniref:Uncharacterized protein n=1 Tax=Penicillium thymicola TaxID=293382 RepID=A0AAI9T8Q6_PENTH|nr:hypothetical protein VN97_g10573 [Penicillium thymicola]